MTDPKPIERNLHVLKDDLPPLQSPNTALVAAATTSGIQLSEDQPFVQTIEEDFLTGQPKRQTVWCLKDMEIEFLPQFEPERISTAEFVRRFRDPQWRLGDGDRQQFNDLEQHLSRKAVPDDQPITIKLLDGSLRQISRGQFHQLLIRAGDYYLALWSNLQQKKIAP